MNPLPENDKSTNELNGNPPPVTRRLREISASTESVSDILRINLIEVREQYRHGLLFFLPEQPDPIVITNTDIISLGRSDPATGSRPVIDLIPYQGALLGVSRFHAEISWRNNTYYIKDLGSTNGTWINSTKIPAYSLHPIVSGDQLRLGYLTMVVKYDRR